MRSNAAPGHDRATPRPALNGTSLTVNEVDGTDFGINFIPHTQKATTWGDVAVGDHVNLEVDTMARYVARLREYD